MNLYIVSTPIGNLEDISLRALRILKEVDLILAEDTRVTRKLLDRYEINTKLESLHEHTDISKMHRLIDLLSEGSNIALVSDAGTPGIQDPGQKFISEILRKDSAINIIPIPGPSSLTAMLSILGVNTDKFLFLGYPPHKKGRQKFFKEIESSIYPVVFFESTHRILKALDSLKEINRQIIVGRELTKKFEKVYRGSVSDIYDELEKDHRGEFVIFVMR